MNGLNSCLSGSAVSILSMAAAKGKQAMVNETYELEMLSEIPWPRFIRMLNLVLLTYPC